MPHYVAELEVVPFMQNIPKSYILHKHESCKIFKLCEWYMYTSLILDQRQGIFSFTPMRFISNAVVFDNKRNHGPSY